MNFTKRLAVVVVIALLSACSGGGGSAPTVNQNNNVQTPTGSTPQTVMIHLAFSIPGGRAPSANSRSPKFVSNQINSAILTAYTPNGGAYRGDNDHLTTVSTYADLTPTSPNCAPPDVNGARSCSIFLPAPVTAACTPGAGADGCDFFEIDTYSGAPSPGTPCGGGAAPACTGVTGNELSIGTDGNGANDNGYAVAAGSNVSVSLGLQGIINNFALTTPATYPNGAGGNYPAPFNVSEPMLVLSGLAGPSTNTPVVLEAQPGFPNAQDPGGQNIRGGSCTNGDLFADGINTNAVPSGGAFYGVDGGASGTHQAVLSLQPCGTNGFLANPTQGINTYFPADQIMAQYLGGGGAGSEEAPTPTAPYFAYITGTSYSEFSSPPGINWNWIATPATAPSAFNHPYPLFPAPGCGTGSCTPEDPIATTAIAVAPLFAQTFTGAANTNESDSAASGHAVLNLAGPGTSGRAYADQVVAPTSVANTTSLGSGYTATLSSACSGTVNSTPQVAASLSATTLLTGSAGTPGYGAKWTVTAGNLPSNGTATGCVITVSDGFNSAKIWVTNSVATGGAVIVIGP
jgi:hypothetical protein